jgi:FkbM family methyltransferase
VDVGAHKADWSWVAHAVWPRARFTLIEPQVELQPYLERFARQVPGSRWLEAGAADAPGELTLTLNPDPASSTLAFTDEEARAAGLAARRVPVITLDSLLVGEHPPELVKIDAEQLELRVLRGAERHFGRTELFVVEVSLFKWEGSTSTFVEVVEFMRDHGYVPYDFCGFQRRPLDGALALTDVAFAREHGLLRSQASWA